MTFSVRKPGLFTTIQDLGRLGYRGEGFAVAGAIDKISAIRANYIVGNDRSFPVLECTQLGPELLFHDYGTFAICGANMKPKLNGIHIQNDEPYHFAPGDYIQLNHTTDLLRAYIAVSGFFDIKKKLGSFSTHTRSGTGGLNGRCLISGDRIQIIKTTKNPIPTRPTQKNSGRFRVIKGPEASISLWQQFVRRKWCISHESDRFGIRLTGKPINTVLADNMRSSPVDIGTVQIPKNGLPIVLMNDSGPTGGYPRIASIIEVDIPRIGQVRIGKCVYFEEVTLEEAMSLRENEPLWKQLIPHVTK